MSWNKPFKTHCTNSYDDWLANKELTKKTACGNLKAAPIREVVLWILAAWESLSKEMIRDSFVSCAITCATDGSQDDEITCLKEGKPCHEGRKLLRERFQLMNTEEPNPFVVDEADVDSANREILTVEEDDVDDDDVEIDN